MLLGDEAVESLKDHLAGGQAEAFPFPARTSGATGAVHVYIDSNDSARTLIVGLYANLNGHPGSLLTTGSLSAPQTGAWDTATVAPTQLVSGTTYWLAVLGTGGTLRYRDRWHGPCNAQTSRQTNLGALAAQWSTGTLYSTCPISAYVTPATSTLPEGPPLEVQPVESPPPPPPPPPAAPANSSPPAISGTATEGQPLTATTGAWTGSPTSYAYQWQDCDTAGASCANVSGAQAAGYTLQTSDVGHTLRVVVTATNSGGSTPASSAATAAVVADPPPPPPPTASFSYTPTSPVAGQPVTLDGTSSTCPDGPCTYNWSDDGSTTRPIPPLWPLGSGQTLLYTFSGAGTKYVRLVVTDATGQIATVEHNVVVEASSTPPPPPTPPSNSGLPTVTGTAQAGQTLTASNGTWSGSTPMTFAYQWQECNSAGEACSNVSGATSSSYALGAGDVGHTVRVVVTASNAGGSSQASSMATATISSSPVTCNTTVTSTMSASTIAHTIASAANGSTVCMEGGTYPAISISGAKHSSYVTVRPKGEAHVVASNWELINSSYLRFEKLESTEFGFRTRDVINHMQWIDNKFTGYRGLVIGGTDPSEDILIEGNTFEKLIPKGTETSTCTTIPGVGEGQGVTLEYVENNITISHNRFKEVAWHYIQGGADTAVNNNSFEGPIPTERHWGELGGGCTHLNVWQIFDGSENDTFNNNIVRGEPGAPAAVTPILFEHGVPSKEGPYPCSDLYTNVTVEGNLFVNASTADVVDIANTNNLVYSHNTVIGGQYGTWLDRSDVCGAGTNLVAEHNIAVDTWSAGAPQRFVLGECTGSCKFDYNVSDDGTANAGGSTHYVTKWSPTWESTTYGNAGLYMATGLPFAAGYQGAVGP